MQFNVELSELAERLLHLNGEVAFYAIFFVNYSTDLKTSEFNASIFCLIESSNAPQPQNAATPIFSTLAGMLLFTNELHP